MPSSTKYIPMFNTFVKHHALIYEQSIKNVSQNVSHFKKYAKMDCETHIS